LQIYGGQLHSRRGGMSLSVRGSMTAEFLLTAKNRARIISAPMAKPAAEAALRTATRANPAFAKSWYNLADFAG